MHIAIIPARGGSKRLPKKNIKIINGKPLIEWTIISAIKSNIFDEIHVNTDCKNIAKISVSAGAKVPFIRSPELASNTATSRDVILDHFNFIKNKTNISLETICILQPTSPIRNYKNIISSYDVLKKKDANSIVSICELEHPAEICNSLNKNESMFKFLDQSKVKRSQDYKKKYRINGAIYILDASLKGDLNNLYNYRTFPYIMDNMSSVDIDTEYDFLLAEFIMSRDYD
jgi:CMP-N-acetylneuraminic acid synthetase